MPNRTRASSNRWPADRAYIPLPHPTWSGEASAAQLAQPLAAADFWTRLGL